MYTPLFYHSNYGKGGSRFSTLFEQLTKYRIQSCGIIDEDLFGLPEFLEYAHAYDIQPIVGTKVTFTVSPIKRSHIYLLVKNIKGYRNLCRIVTERAFRELHPRFLQQHAEGLVLISNSLDLLELFKRSFQNIYYLLLPFHGAISRRFPLVAAYDIHYVTMADQVLYKLLCAIKKYTITCARGRPEHLVSPRDFARFYEEFPDAVLHNLEMAELCTFAPHNFGPCSSSTRSSNNFGPHPQKSSTRSSNNFGPCSSSTRSSILWRF